MLHSYRRLSAVVAVLSVTSTPAFTQTPSAPDSSTSLSEVLVTATRREERLQDVPISVSSLSQEQLDSTGLRTIDDLARLAPGVAFERNGISSSSNYNDETSDINIRGIDSTAGTSTTAIYIDETPVQSRHIGFGSVNVFPQLFDLDRVEVLRGPQGTLFGAGAEGGALRFLEAQPNMVQFEGYARSELATTEGGAPSYELGAAAGGPMSDTLAYRVSASYRFDGGWVDRAGYDLVQNPSNPLNPTAFYNGITTARDSNWHQTATFRAALKWVVTDVLTVSPSVYWQRLEINDTAAYWPALSNPDEGVLRNGNALTNPSTDPFWLTAVKLDWSLDSATLTSNTSFYSRDQHSTSDITQFLQALYASFGQLGSVYPSPGTIAFAPFSDTQRNFYQEVRLASRDGAAKLSWTGGLYFAHLDENIAATNIAPSLDAQVISYTTNNPNFPDGPESVCTTALPCPGGVIFRNPINRVVDRQLAAFGEGTYKLSDTWRLTAGLRYSYLGYTGSIFQTGPFIGSTVSGTIRGSDHPLTPKVALAWQPARDELVYASAAKGFRPGGPNSGVGALCNGSIGALGLSSVPPQYASDSLWSYELGSKATLLDRRLEVNASVFYVDWNNIQQNVYLPTCGQQYTGNVGKAKSTGAELELRYRPVQSLTASIAAAYTDARYTKTVCVGSLAATTANGTTYCTNANIPIGSGVLPIVTSGDQLFGSPLTLGASAEYTLRAWGESSPYVRVDLQHSQGQKGLISTIDPSDALADPTLPKLPTTNTLAARAGLRRGGFDVSVFGQNLTNSHPVLFASRDVAPVPYNAPPTDLLYFERGIRPRTFGLTGTFRY